TSRLAPGSNKGDVAGGVYESLAASRQPGWHFEAQLNAPVSFSPSQGGARFSTGATLTYYFEKLRDDPPHPLGMLTFLQHPSFISVAASVQFSSSGVSSYFGAAVTAAIYPWQRTGFVGSLAGYFTSPSSGLTLALGIEHYLSSNLRVDASYIGSRARADYVSDTGSAPSSTSDGGLLGVSTLWAHESLFTNFSVMFYRFSQEGSFRYNGTVLAANLNNEYFLGRRVSLGAALRFSRAPYPGAVVYTLSGGPLIKAYVRETVLLTASYTTAFITANSPAGPGSDYHVVDLGLAWRL